MKYIYYFLCQILFCSILSAYSYGQQACVRGKIVDFLSKQSLAAATIKLGNKITKSDAEGNFAISFEAEGSLKTKLTVSYIGYEEQQAELSNTDVFLFIEMKHTENRLGDVEVSSFSPSILEKAILAIEKNYSQEPFYMFCDQFIEERTNLSEYLMRDTAKLKVYIPGYKKEAESAQIQVISNRRSIMQSESSKSLRKSAGLYYTVVGSDHVQRRNGILDIKRIKEYQITVNNIILYQGRPTYSVDFNKKKGTGFSGTLLIDSSTLAFVSITLYPNDKLRKQKALLTGYKDFFFFEKVNYKYNNGRWFFESSICEQYQRMFDLWLMKNNNYYGSIEVNCLYTSTSNVLPIEKADRIKKTDRTIDINKPDRELQIIK